MYILRVTYWFYLFIYRHIFDYFGFQFGILLAASTLTMLITVHHKVLKNSQMVFSDEDKRNINRMIIMKLLIFGIISVFLTILPVLTQKYAIILAFLYEIGLHITPLIYTYKCYKMSCWKDVRIFEQSQLKSVEMIQPGAN